MLFQQRYEFYTPIDCVGFCYFGETSSLRLLQRIGVNQLTSMCRNNNSSNGNTALLTNRGEARKRKRPEYGTVLLKVCTMVIMKMDLKVNWGFQYFSNF